MTDMPFMCFIPASEKVISSSYLQQILPGGEHREILLVVTEFNLHLFIKTNSSSGINEFACHPYCNLFYIDFIDELTFRLTFSSNNNQNPFDGKNTFILTLVNKAPSTITEVIYNTAKITLPSSNYLRVNRKLKESSFPRIYTDIPPSYRIFMHRYRALLAWKKIFPPQFSLQKLRDFLLTKPTVIDLGVIIDLDLDVSTFIHASDVVPRLSSIIIPGDIKPSLLFGILKKVLPYCTHIQKITITKNIDQSFYNFLNFLNRQNKISIQIIQFQDCQIPQVLIKSMQTLLMKHKIALSIIRCDLSQTLNKLFSIINTTENLSNLNLTSVLLNRSQNFPEMWNLTHLSLRGCGIDIYSILSSLDQTVPNIQYLDLSRNDCLTRFPQTIVIPECLTDLFLSQIHWSPSNFFTIFKSCCYTKRPISLSLADAIFTSRRESFRQFYGSFQDILNIENPNFYALYWNHNHIRSIFLQFLLKCNNLKFISFSGCKIKHHVVRMLQKFVETHNSLHTFDLHGSIHVTFTDMLSKLFYWLKKSRHIRRIDISKNKMGPQCIQSLAELISTNMKINQILIDEFDITEYSSLLPLINALKDRKAPIYVQYPEETFSKLKERGEIDDENLRAIRSLFRSPYAPKEQDCAQQWQLLIDQEYPEWPRINAVKDLSNNSSIIPDDNHHSISKFKLEDVNPPSSHGHKHKAKKETANATANNNNNNNSTKIIPNFFLFDVPLPPDEDFIRLHWEKRKSLDALSKALESSFTNSKS